ncbi:MAG: zinc ribbon domain-containing protein [Gemmatimonadetes bacterium]|nr:zinc ribbon domain-containing protein [Gemmatimonadota bacterium]
MILELITAMLLGALVLWMALGALGTQTTDDGLEEADPLEETPRGRALLAIKELEFDRATGKVSDEDYQSIRGRLAFEATEVLGRSAAVSAPAVTTLRGCPQCGPRPEAGARFCSACGFPAA